MTLSAFGADGSMFVQRREYPQWRRKKPRQKKKKLHKRFWLKKKNVFAIIVAERATGDFPWQMQKASYAWRSAQC
jgi:hypothetical protein